MQDISFFLNCSTSSDPLKIAMPSPFPDLLCDILEENTAIARIVTCFLWHKVEWSECMMEQKSGHVC